MIFLKKKKKRKTLNKAGQKGNFLNLTKGIYEKLIANVIIINERLNTISLISGTGKDVTSIHCYTEGSIQCSQARKRNQKFQIGNEDVKLSLFTDNQTI